MKTLITGGAGFIGSAVVSELKRSGHEIFVLDNLSFGKREFVDVDDDHFFKVDIRDNNAVKMVFSIVDPELLIHLAAIHFIPYCNQHPFEAADINIRGTMNVIDACKSAKSIERVFFASTAAVYPIYDDAVSEDHPQLPLDIYGLTKLTGEHLFKKYWMETSKNTIVCRFFNAFGPNETNPHLIPEIEKQLRDGLRTIKLGNLSPKRDFIHTHDMASAVRILLSREYKGYDIFNLGRGIEYSVVEIVEAFERQLNEKITVEVDPARVRNVERQHLLADVTKLKSIGWNPKWGIDEGINDLIQNW